jgi:hypothetical protein
MGTCAKEPQTQDGVVEYLEQALETDHVTEKDFHLKQAPQLMRIE